MSMTVEGAPVGKLSLAANVARSYYLHGQTKTEIAADLGLSRFKVARLLDLARSSGLVHISVTDPGAIDAGLCDRLRMQLGLHRAIVVDTDDGDPDKVRDRLAGLTASLLEQTLTSTDVLGLAWSRSVLETAARVQRLPSCEVVQLSGALTWPDVAMTLVEAVQRLGRIGGGRGYAFYAPLFVSDPASVEVIHRQPEVATAFARFASVTTAVVSIGCWRPAASTLHDTMTNEEREALYTNGVMADVCGRFLDGSGVLLPMPMARQVVGISAKELRAIPNVIAIASGKEKSAAVRIAARAGYIKTLVTTSRLAVELLAMA